MEGRGRDGVRCRRGAKGREGERVDRENKGSQACAAAASSGRPTRSEKVGERRREGSTCLVWVNCRSARAASTAQLEAQAVRVL